MIATQSHHAQQRIVFFILAFGLLFATGIAFADDIDTTVDVGNAAPSISNLSMNGGSNVTLTENNSVFATSTMTVTDSNGCGEITDVTAKFYLTPIANSGTTCSQDDENCYVSTCSATTTGNTCDGGADTSVEYDCGFKLWYIASPTDVGSPSASSIWSVAATSTDGSGSGTATNTAETIEVNTLASLDVTASIAYGSVSAGSNTGGTNQTTTLTNTGNASLDSDIGGDVMCTDYPGCDGDSFSHTQQKFDTSDVTYASLTNTLAASTSPATIAVDLAKPTATTSAVTDDLYWGIAIPGGQPSGSYTGQNSISATAD